jgi:hypothetical protein
LSPMRSRCVTETGGDVLPPLGKKLLCHRKGRSHCCHHEPGSCKGRSCYATTSSTWGGANHVVSLRPRHREEPPVPLWACVRRRKHPPEQTAEQCHQSGITPSAHCHSSKHR